MAPANVIVTISRQLGAGGTVLGQRLARRLNFAYLDQEILRQAAEQIGRREEDVAGWEERVARFWDRLLGSFAVGPPESVFTSVPGVPTVPGKALFEAESRVMRELVSGHDAVVIGRAGFYVLREHPGLVSVFLHAPAAARVPRIVAKYRLPNEAEARRMIEWADRERDRFLRERTGYGLTDSCHYDLCINTARISMETAEEMIVQQVNRLR